MPLVPMKDSSSLKPVSLKGGTLIPVDESQATPPKFNGKAALKSPWDPGVIDRIKSGEPNIGLGGQLLAAGEMTQRDLTAIPAHFFNQMLLNYPRALWENKLGLDYPDETFSPVAGAVAKGAGFYGALKNPILKAFKITPASGLGKEMLASAATGAAYSPEDPTDLKSRGINAAIGAAVPPGLKFGGKVAGAILKAPATVVEWSKDKAGRVVDSILKPAKGLFSYGKDPGGEVARQGIIAKNFDDLIGKIGGKMNEVGGSIEKILKNAAEQNHRVDASGLGDLIDSEIAGLRQFEGSNSTAINRLQTFKDDLLNTDLSNMTPAEATALKRKIGNMTKFTGNPSDDEVFNKTLKSVYGHLKEKINQAVPEVAGPNEVYSNLLSAKEAAINREPIALRRDIVSLAQKAVIGGGLTGSGAASGIGLAAGGPSAAAGAAAFVAVDKLLGSMTAKTTFAKVLADLGEADKSKFIQAIKKVPELHRIVYRALEHGREPIFTGKAKPKLLPAPPPKPLSSGAAGETFQTLSEDEAKIVYDVLERSREAAKTAKDASRQRALPDRSREFKMLSPEEEAIAQADYRGRVREKFTGKAQKLLPEYASGQLEEQFGVSDVPRNVRSSTKPEAFKKASRLSAKEQKQVDELVKRFNGRAKKG